VESFLVGEDLKIFPELIWLKQSVLSALKKGVSGVSLVLIAEAGSSL